MSRGLLIGGLALGGGVALALAFREREPIGRTAVEVQSRVKQAVQKGVRKVTETVQQLTGGIKQEFLDRIAQHDIATLVEQYRGKVPWSVAMAMMEHESGFDPTIYNFYKYKSDVPGSPDHITIKDSKGRPILGGHEHAAEGAGPWGEGWFKYDPHAIGLYQILDTLRKSYPKLDGSTPTTRELVIPKINIQCALSARSKEAEMLAPYAGGNPVFLAELLYFCHAEGRGKLTGGKYPGAFSKLKEAGKAITWANIVSLPWGASGWWAIGNRLSGIALVGGRAAVWEKNQPGLLQMGPPEPTGVGAVAGDTVASITQSTVDVLIAQAQEAEMERDLDTAAALRAQLDALNADGTAIT